MARAKAWCFTVNNYTDEDLTALESIDCRYLVYGKEVGESGTPHLQGYIVYENSVRLAQVSKAIPRAHIEKAKGNPQQASEYCMKDGDYVERGDRPMTQKEKGKVSQELYREMLDLAEQGKWQEMKEMNPGMLSRHLPTYQRWNRLVREEAQMDSMETLDFHWFVGPTGSGKSRTAREENPGAYLKACNKWWCGYKGQDVVIIDEWQPEHECLAHHLKRWCDHHPFSAEMKGGTMVIRPKKIIVTSNYELDECFTRVGDLDPLKRRFFVRRFNFDD